MTQGLSGKIPSSVSNHGGNNLDTTPAWVRRIPAIADAVSDRVEVLLDAAFD